MIRLVMLGGRIACMITAVSALKYVIAGFAIIKIPLVCLYTVHKYRQIKARKIVVVRPGSAEWSSIRGVA